MSRLDIEIRKPPTDKPLPRPSDTEKLRRWCGNLKDVDDERAQRVMREMRKHLQRSGATGER